MIQIAFATLCAFAAGMLLAIPMGMGINAKLSPLVAIPIALVFMSGIVTCAYYFFAPGSAFYVAPR